MSDGKENPRLNAHDWRTIYRVFDNNLELEREIDEDKPEIRYMEILRDSIAEEMVDAIAIERARRVEAFRESAFRFKNQGSISYPDRDPEARVNYLADLEPIDDE